MSFLVMIFLVTTLTIFMCVALLLFIYYFFIYLFIIIFFFQGKKTPITVQPKTRIIEGKWKTKINLENKPPKTNSTAITEDIRHRFSGFLLSLVEQ